MNKQKMLVFFLVLSLVGNVIFLLKLWQYNNEIKDKNAMKFPLLGLYTDVPVDSNQDNPAGSILHYNQLRVSIGSRFHSSDNTEGNVSVYLQDIKKGSWMGINEKEGFVPASLLKVPIAIAIMKKVENGELSLDQKIEIKSGDIDSFAGVPERFKAGETKTVFDLIEMMLKISDNTSKNVLKGLLSDEEVNSVFVHIGINNPYLEDNEDKMVTTRQFSRIFKSLYFSTYLKPENSEKILELLTDTREESLISAGVPYDVQVAHKYGERSDALHDCGIVYEKNNPYFLCIMTRQIDLISAKSIIKDISQEIYQYASQYEQ